MSSQDKNTLVWTFDREKIFPRLVNNFADEGETPSAAVENWQPVTDPFRENIETIYLLDSENIRKWISFHDIENWSLARDELREIALQNTRKLFQTSFLRQEIAPGLFAVSILYDLESSLLLVGQEWFEDLVSSQNVMAIAPYRDALLFGDRSSPVARKNILAVLDRFWEECVPSHRLAKSILIRDTSHPCGWAFMRPDILLQSLN